MKSSKESLPPSLRDTSLEEGGIVFSNCHLADLTSILHLSDTYASIIDVGVTAVTEGAGSVVLLI